jgi:hypothetical protein
MLRKIFLRRQLKWLLLVIVLIVAAVGAYLAYPRPLPPPIPENMKTVETDKVSLLLPKAWTQVSNLSTIKPVLSNAVGNAPNFDEFFDYAAQNVDTAYLNFLRIQGVFIFIENTGAPIDMEAQQTRLNELWLNANMTPTGIDNVNVPAGEMLHIELTNTDEKVKGKAVVYSLSQGENWYVIGFLARNEEAMTELQPTIDAIVYNFGIKE